MKALLLSTDERLVLFDTLCLRRDFVTKLLSDYDFEDEPIVLENYCKELRVINSILTKMGFFN